MSTSILNDVKHILGVFPEDTAFDIDIMMAINTQFANLHQIGAGPVMGYEITGPENTWDEFIDDIRMNSVKSYIYLTVKLMFDPPKTGFTTDSFDRQIAQLEYRINVVADYG